MWHHSDPRIREYESLELFQGCTRRQVRMLVRLSTRLPAPTGRTLARQGSRRRELILVVEGAADVVRDGQVVDHLGAGDHCGEFTVLRNVPQPATVVAAAPSIIDVFEAREFIRAYEQIPALHAAIDRTLDRRTAAWLSLPAGSTTTSPGSPVFPALR